jgi:hypothetical protein
MVKDNIEVGYGRIDIGTKEEFLKVKCLIWGWDLRRRST